MARQDICPPTVKPPSPETFTVLHRRMSAAEEQTESLIKDLARLGVNMQSFDHFALRTKAPSEARRSITPPHARVAFVGDSDTQWKTCESLVNRMCHMESFLQTLKLNLFRLQTEKELNPRHSDQLQERMAALQDEHTQEMKAKQMELMRLRQKLCEMCEGRERVQDENERLSAALEMATATKTDVAVAAEELRVTKSRMSRRMHELQEQLSQETSLRASLEDAQAAMMRRIQDLEKVVEAERKEVLVLQQDSKTLRSDTQALREQHQQEEQRAEKLEQEHTYLKAELDARDAIITQLREEGKNAHSALSKEQAENSRLVWDIMSMKEMAEKVQDNNEQLDRQCSELSSTLRNLTIENAKLVADHQAALKAEQEKMNRKLHEQDLLLDAARSNITAELQAAQAERDRLQRELSSLQVEHSECVEKERLAEEKMEMRKELVESTFVRLREDLESLMKARDSLTKERDTLTKEKESLLQEKNRTVKAITEQRNELEAELTENKLDLCTVKSSLQSQEEENMRLMDRLASMEHQQHAQQQVEQALSELTESKKKLAYEKGKLQTRVQQLETELESLADARSENTQLRKMNTALEAKYNQVNAEFSSGKIHVQRLDAQLKQAQSVVERQEQDFALAIQSRDESLRESQKMKGQMEALEEREQQKIVFLQRQLSDVKEDNSKVTATLENVLTSHNRLQQSLEKLQVELGGKDSEITGLRKERSQNQQRIQRFESELAECQARLLSMDTQQRNQVEPLRKSYEVSREDNKKLALSLEQSLQSNSNLQNKLNRLQDDLDSKELQFQQLQNCRDQESEEAKVAAKLSMERLEALKKQFQMERESAKKRARKDTTELKKALEDATSKYMEVSCANRLLREKMAELERILTNQKIKIKSQKAQLKRYRETKATGIPDADTRKATESDLKQMVLLKEQYQKENHEQSLKIQEFLTEMTSLQSEIQELAMSQQEVTQVNQRQERLLGEEREHHWELEKRCQSLEDTVRQLRKYKEVTERTLKEASLESEQITVNLEEAHRWFKVKFDSLKQELMESRQRSTPSHSELGLGEKEVMQDESDVSLSLSSLEAKDSDGERPVKLPNYSMSNHWEGKQDLSSRTYQAEKEKK
ncbi:coiled-coil domain-containing protein 150 [Ambystoma mexicanum]|uniref:coiled-coil domain-containing protein 150 n=1 Tax=Ambystoma mexicanum TaxID=8296 RepID=UPI0037E78E98